MCRELIMSPGVPRKKVLIIEDEPVIARLYRKILSEYEFDIDITENGLTARQLAEKTEYDIYISEIRVPGLSGLEFYQYLLQKRPGSANRMIFTTADVISQDLKEFTLNTHAPLLIKPFTPDELRKLVEKIN